jgi:DNA polymerase-3 subunit delta'
MARGGPGRALRLAATKALEIDEAARELVQRLPAIDRSGAQALADTFRGAEGAQRFALLMDRIAAALHARAAAGVLDGRGGFERDAEAWSLVSDLPGEAEGINLDRADAFFTALGRLAALA